MPKTGPDVGVAGYDQTFAAKVAAVMEPKVAVRLHKREPSAALLETWSWSANAAPLAWPSGSKS